MKARDLTGQVFGHLTAIKQEGRAKDGHLLWLCQCDCGNTTHVTVSHLTSGHTTSCGHVKKDANHSIRPGYESKRVDGVATFLLSSNRKKRPDNTTGVTGVRRIVNRGGSVSYLAQIDVNGKRYHLGTFPTFESAVEARHEAEKKLIPKNDGQ